MILECKQYVIVTHNQNMWYIYTHREYEYYQWMMKVVILYFMKDVILYKVKFYSIIQNYFIYNS